MNHKIYSAALALVLAATGTAFAQTAPAAAPNAAAPAPAGAHYGHGYGAMLRSLNLSDAQQSQIKTIMQNVRAQNANADENTRHANMKQARTQIEAILTPAQRQQLTSKIAAARAARANQAPMQGTPNQPAPSQPAPAQQ